jgi:hypothetical protein
MAKYPVAVLKFTWADTPFANGAPMGLTYSDLYRDRVRL